MNNERIKNLIDKYNAKLILDFELEEIEQLIESGDIAIDELHDLCLLEDKIFQLKAPAPTAALDDRFYQMLAVEKTAIRGRFSWSEFFSWPVLAPRLTVASVALVIGFFIGLLIESPRENTEVKNLTREVADLKEMMMLSLLEKESATERLKAVSLTEEMDEVSSKVTTALLQTLNTDENVNVRLAALDALLPYVHQDNVRAALVRSLSRQESPLVQLALAELMVSIQEKSSVNALKQILQDEKTPKDIKKKMKESIKILT